MSGPCGSSLLHRYFFDASLFSACERRHVLGARGRAGVQQATVALAADLCAPVVNDRAIVACHCRTLRERLGRPVSFGHLANFFSTPTLLFGSVTLACRASVPSRW